MSDRITLSTGTEVDANCGVVGIDAALDTYGGYDERIEYEVTEPGGRADLTPADRRAWPSSGARSRGRSPSPLPRPEPLQPQLADDGAHRAHDQRRRLRVLLGLALDRLDVG